MKVFIVFCGLLCIAVHSVNSASFYYRNARELNANEAVAAVLSETKPLAEETVIKTDEIVSELRKDEAQKIDEPIPVAVVEPIFKEEIIVPIDTLRIAEPVIAIQEPAGVISENKPVKDEIIAEPAVLVAVDSARADADVVPAKLENLELSQPAEALNNIATIQETVKAAAEEALRESNIVADEVVIVEKVDAPAAPVAESVLRLDAIPLVVSQPETVVAIDEPHPVAPVAESRAEPLVDEPLPVAPANRAEPIVEVKSKAEPIVLEVEVPQPAAVAESEPALVLAPVPVPAAVPAPVESPVKVAEAKSEPAPSPVAAPVEAQPEQAPIAEAKKETATEVKSEITSEIKSEVVPEAKQVPVPVPDAKAPEPVISQETETVAFIAAEPLPVVKQIPLPQLLAVAVEKNVDPLLEVKNEAVVESVPEVKSAAALPEPTAEKLVAEPITEAKIESTPQAPVAVIAATELLPEVKSVPELVPQEPVAVDAENVVVEQVPEVKSVPVAVPVAVVAENLIVPLVAEAKSVPEPAPLEPVAVVAEKVEEKVVENVAAVESVPAVKSILPQVEVTKVEAPVAEAKVEVPAQVPVAVDSPVPASRSAIPDAAPAPVPEAPAAIPEKVESEVPTINAEKPAEQPSVRDASAIVPEERQQPTPATPAQPGFVQQAQGAITGIINTIVRRPTTEEGEVASTPVVSTPVEEDCGDACAVHDDAPVQTTTPPRPGFIQAIQNTIQNVVGGFRPERRTTIPSDTTEEIITEKPTSRRGNRPIPILNQNVEIVDDKVDINKS